MKSGAGSGGAPNLQGEPVAFRYESRHQAGQREWPDTLDGNEAHWCA